MYSVIFFRAQTAISFQALLRYHQHKLYSYADIFLFDYPKGCAGLGPKGMTAVYLVCDGGKTNKNGRCNSNCIVRSQNVMSCPVGALVDFMFYLVHIRKEPLPNPITEKSKFYDKEIFETARYDVDSARRREAYSKLKFYFSATMHVDRRHGAIAQQIRG